MVVGAGISGVTAALEAAEAGREVILVEREPSIGGRVLRSHNYFPKLCPPSCGMEINTQRLKRNPRIMVFTNTTVTKAERNDQGWSVTLKTAAAYVNSRCTVCDDCAKACPVKVPDPFNLGLTEAPAIRLPHLDAWPQRYVLDRAACPDGCTACVEACNFGAIDLDAQAQEKTVTVGAAVLATGWHPYPLEKLTDLGGGVLPDVINNVTLERLASPTGPTAGKILRPSDDAAPQRVAFVQCAGSRDVNHLPYCSGVCCLASLKQAMYVKEQLPESEVTIYYIDRRTPGRNEDMLTQVTEMEGVTLVKGKVGKIEKGNTNDLVLKVEDVDSGRLLEAKADLVVLATGMVSNMSEQTSPFAIQTDADGFGLDDKEAKLFVTGVAKRPEDVAASDRDATGTAAKACVAVTGGAK
jgi:quinone-modifying oxidoreductase subunit QmoA